MIVCVYYYRLCCVQNDIAFRNQFLAAKLLDSRVEHIAQPEMNLYRVSSLRGSLVRNSGRIGSQSRHFSSLNTFWQWTTKSRPPWKENYKEAAVAVVVFGITGSLSMVAVRPCLKSVFGLEGSFTEGPNSYRIASLVIVSPFYAAILLAIGTLSGRHNYFAKMSFKILGRFFPKSLLHEVACTPAKVKNATK